MPTIPPYDNSQVNQRALNLPQATPDSFGAQQAGTLGRVGQALDAGSNVAGAIYERQVQSEVFAAEAKAKEAYGLWSAQEMGRSQGENAQGLAQRAADWWKQTTEQSTKGMNPMGARMLTQALQRQGAVSVGDFAKIENQQLDANFAQQTDSTVNQSIKLAAGMMTPDNLKLQRDNIRAALGSYGARKGWDDVTLKDKTDTAIANMHMAVFNNMLASSPVAAQAYFDDNRKEFNPTTLDEVQNRLKVGVAGVEGGGYARAVFGEFTQGKGADDALPERQMDAKLVEKFGDKPEQLKAAREELGRQMGLWNTQVTQTSAKAVNKVMDAYGGGITSISKLQTMPEWELLTGSQRNQITEHVSDRNHMLATRGVEDKARLERELQDKMAGAYFSYSDPAKLATMSRDQVQALLPVLGRTYTDHLLQRKDSLTSALNKENAKMDDDDFKSIAANMGLDPYDTKASKEDKARLGTLKFRTEQLIDAAQQAKKAPLTRSEKYDLMRQEIARTVSKPTWFGLSSEEVPVVGLNPDEVKKIEVPSADRAQISTAMQTMYQQTKNPAFEPTEENLKRWYLRAKSRSADLIPPKK